MSFSGFTVTEVTTDAATRAVTRSSTAPFGKPGDVVTIGMSVVKNEPPVAVTENYFADYVLSQDGTWKPAPQNEPLRWQSVNYMYHFNAYYPALTVQEKEEAQFNTIGISLPSNWTEDDYRKYGRRMQSPKKRFPIGSPVSLSLRLLLTRIEVSIDPATGITDATHLTMYTKTEGAVGTSAIIAPSGDVQAMNLWRSPSPAGTTPGTASAGTAPGTASAGTTAAGTPADANPVFLGYAIPQTYAPGTLLLKHHTPGLHGARNYTVDVNPNFPDGLVTKGGEVVSFTVAATAPWVHVDKAGGLEAALNAAYPTGDYPTRLKITGELDYDDLRYLVNLTKPDAAGSNVTTVDMEGALVEKEAFDNARATGPFSHYNGSIKNLVLPSSLSTVPYAAFIYSTLTSVTLPEGPTKIDIFAFQDCKYLKSITLPPSVTTLGLQAFADSGLTTIELPEALTEIDARAFWDCTDLQQVALPGNKPINVGADAFKGINSSCHLFLYAPGLDASGSSIQEYLSDTWGGTTWANVHWGYKGSGSRLNPENYEYHKVVP